MQTIEHLEGTMTDSEEGHSSEVNLFSTRIKSETDRATSAVFHHLSECYYPNKNTKESRTLCHYHEGYEDSCNHRELIVDPISIEQFLFGPTDNRHSCCF